MGSFFSTPALLNADRTILGEKLVWKWGRAWWAWLGQALPWCSKLPQCTHTGLFVQVAMLLPTERVTAMAEFLADSVGKKTIDAC